MKYDRCPTCGRTQIRSSEANRRYWALLNEISEKIKPEGSEYSPNTWHLYFKQKLLGSMDIPMPNGKVVTIPQTTTALDTSQFNDYMGKVEAWAAKRNVFLPD